MMIPPILTPSTSQGIRLSPFLSRLCLLITKKLVSYSCLTCKSITHVLILGWHTLSKHLTHTFLFIFHRLDEMRGEKPYSWTEPRKIPTFFPPEDRPKGDQAYGYHLGIAIIGMLFGLIHCLGWSLVFPSGTERLVWRISAVIISGLPVLIVFSYSIILFLRFVFYLFFPRALLYDPEGSSLRRKLMHLYVNWVGIPINGFRTAIWWIFVILIPIYLLARMALLVEAFLSLRALPSGAYSVVNWTEYLPHI